MTRHNLPIGAIGTGLALAGMIGYTLAPDKLWLVTLCEALALLCLTWFFIAHLEQFKAFSTRRSTRAGAHSALVVMLFVGILIIVNFLAARHSVRWDLSENQNYTLAPETHRVLRGLPREVSITVFTREKDPGYQSYKERLDSYRQASHKLSVQFVDPERQPKVAQNYSITRTDTAIFESGPQSVPDHLSIRGGNYERAHPGVERQQKSAFCFSKDTASAAFEDKDRGGLALTKEALQKRGYGRYGHAAARDRPVPADTDVLVLAGPRRPVTKEEKDRILAYVAKGRHVMALVDPDTQAGLDDLLKAWGVDLGPGVLVDLQDRLAQGDLTRF
ncbi:MAG: GldG family protein [Nitrospiraceae bacterium]